MFLEIYISKVKYGLYIFKYEMKDLIIILYVFESLI